MGARTIAVLTILNMCGVCASAKVIYVDDDAAPGGDGTSWASAYRLLQDGLTDARETPVDTGGGDNGGGGVRRVMISDSGFSTVEVRVAQGVYLADRSEAEPEGSGSRYASFELFSGVAMIGGYAGIGEVDPNARDVMLYQTVLSGDLNGDDAPVDDPRDLRMEPTRNENTCNIVMVQNASGVRLEGFTIRAGEADIPGRCTPPRTSHDAGLWAILVRNLMVRDCVFEGTSGIFGGGCGLERCTNFVIDRCTFTGNDGTLGIQNSTGVVSGCRLTGNLGAMGISRGDVLVADCIVANNREGVSLVYGQARFERCVITGNTSDYEYGYGGGMTLRNGSYSFLECSFSNNSSVARGGGLVIVEGGEVRLDNCIFSGNRSLYGGAIYSELSTELRVTNCTIADNRAVLGRFLCCRSTYVRKSTGNIWVKDSIVANGGNEIVTDDTGIWLNNSLLPDGPEAIVDPNNNVTFGVGNISGDPCFAEPGYWDDKDTVDDPNDDVFVTGDYHPKSQGGRWNAAADGWVLDETTSPCVDAGNAARPIGWEPFPNGGRTNMGAYGGTKEASKSYFGGPLCDTIVAGDINGDCRVDFTDLALLAGNWGFVGEISEAGPGSGTVGPR